MIVVLADGDPNVYQFWVAKVIKVITGNEDVTGVEVHWCATNTHRFNGMYKTEMVVGKKIGGKRKGKGTNVNCCCTNLLKLEDVGILVYEFNLKKRGTLHFKTIEIMKRLLPKGRVLRWEFAETIRRSRRILKPEKLGMHVDLDGAQLMKEKNMGPASSHSSEDVNSDGMQENMNDFE